MTKDPAKLDRIQDTVFASKDLEPRLVDGLPETFCNVACDRVATAYGCDAMHDLVTHEPFTADVMCMLLSGSKDFLVKPMADCQELVNGGTLIFAAMNSETLGQAHGHIVTLTPGKQDYSGHWNCKTPLCMNVGAMNFRCKGVQWAFPVQKGPPSFFAWVPSL